MRFNVQIKWKEDEDKSYECRHYNVNDFKDAVELILKYYKNDEIIWIKIYNEAQEV